jgi:hypothetical protein
MASHSSDIRVDIVKWMVLGLFCREQASSMLKKSCMNEEQDEGLVPEKMRSRNLEERYVISCDASNLSKKAG